MGTNAGIDMWMMPGDKEQSIIDYFTTYKRAIDEGLISMERVEQALANIIAVKMAMGLVPHINKKLEVDDVKVEVEDGRKNKAKTEYEDSLTAVHESMVLLKNDQALPVKTSKLEYVVLVGERIISVWDNKELFQNFDDIGLQCGGWSLRWQGFEGNPMWTG